MNTLEIIIIIFSASSSLALFPKTLTKQNQYSFYDDIGNKDVGDVIDINLKSRANKLG